MSSISIKQLYRSTEDYINKNIKVSGWVKTERTSKNFGFIELNDGSFFKNLQIVFEEGIENFNDVAKLSVGSAIIAEGVLTESPGAKQPFELKADKIVIEGRSTPDYPLQKKNHSFEFLRSIAH
ncbi:MAG TPA: OB-fold nucleic acid binding domain-containing protein, partial [Bacillota bacterium]|nr:OB-fold nucleic acid binding domain-containing protein [Bacillota bacterium]